MLGDIVHIPGTQKTPLPLVNRPVYGCIVNQINAYVCVCVSLAKNASTRLRLNIQYASANDCPHTHTFPICVMEMGVVATCIQTRANIHTDIRPITNM